MQNKWVRLTFYRFHLAILQLLAAWVVLRSLFPFPEEPARIQAFGFCALLSLILVAFFALKTRFRMFIWLFAVVQVATVWHLYGYTQKLALMLLPRYLEFVTMGCLVFVLIFVFAYPATWSEFCLKTKDYMPPTPRFIKSGFHF